MRTISGLPKAAPVGTSEEVELLTLVFDTEPPQITKDNYQQMYRQLYAVQASIILDAMEQHIPGGLYDALFAEMARRKASIFRVAYKG